MCPKEKEEKRREGVRGVEEERIGEKSQYLILNWS